MAPEADVATVRVTRWGGRGLAGGPAIDYPLRMQNFIDLAGASGVTYRFHRVDDMEKLPAIAGNFVYVRTEGESSVVVCCGTDETLLRAGVRWPDAMQSHGADTVYVRKNVSWRVRATEHEDIAKQHRPPLIVAKELDRLS